MVLLSMRTAIDNDLEERTNEIWTLVRENRNSLDSERYCRLIREAMDAAVVAVYEKLEPLFSEVEDLKHKLTAARAKAKADLAAHEAVVSSLQTCNKKLVAVRIERRFLRAKCASPSESLDTTDEEE